MTSKSSFIRLMKEDGKRRLWVFALTFLAAFFSMTVFVAMCISRYESGWNARDIKSVMVTDLMQDNMPGLIFFTAVAALLCGFSSFSYLHSKKKVDFYHSLPVKRETLFLVNYCNGILIYAASYLINWLICMVLAAANGGEIGASAIGSLAAFGYNLSYFILIYSVVVLSAILTGNLVVNMLGSAVLMFCGPIICLLLDGYYSTMFMTYYGRSGGLLQYLEERISPITAYFCGHSGWGALLAAAVITVLCAVLFRMRRSEAAGKAMAFGPSMAPIKFVIVLVSSMVAGLIFYGIVDTGIWMFFGVLCGCLLSYCAVEVIYHFDFKKAFAHKFHLLGCAAACALLFSIFQFDLLGYDSYLPKKSNVESVAMTLYEKDWIPVSSAYYREAYGEYFMNYESASNYQLDNMKLTDYDLVYPLLERSVELTEAKRNKKVDEWFQIHGEEEDAYLNRSLIVKYNLKNGKTVYRSYYIWLDDMQDTMNQIRNSKEYKEGMYPILGMDPASLNHITYQELEDNFELKLSAEQMAALLAAYQMDLLDSKEEDTSDLVTVGTLSFVDNNLAAYYKQQVENGYQNDNYLEWSATINQYPVFTSYANTEALLRSYGVKLGQSLAAEDISEIRISDYKVSELEEQDKEKVGDSSVIDEYGYYSVGYDEEEQIKQLLPAMVYDSYTKYNDYAENIGNLDVRADIKKENGSKKTYRFQLIESKVPEFVKKDLHFELTRPEK